MFHQECRANRAKQGQAACSNRPEKSRWYQQGDWMTCAAADPVMGAVELALASR